MRCASRLSVSFARYVLGLSPLHQEPATAQAISNTLPPNAPNASATFIHAAPLSLQHFKHLWPSGLRHSLCHCRPIVSASGFGLSLGGVPPPPTPLPGPLPVLPVLPPPGAPEPPPDDGSVNSAGQHIPPISIHPGAQLWTGIVSPPGTSIGTSAGALAGVTVPRPRTWDGVIGQGLVTGLRPPGHPRTTTSSSSPSSPGSRSASRWPIGARCPAGRIWRHAGRERAGVGNLVVLQFTCLACREPFLLETSGAAQTADPRVVCCPQCLSQTQAGPMTAHTELIQYACMTC
jgi:hypothetical protein